MNNTKNKKILIYFLAFIIPVIILIIDYYLVGIFPFGDKTILYRDLKGQYVSYFSELRNAVLGNGGLLYSFTKGLGGNMIGIITYYMMSPFNILIFMFPKDMITEAILTITILKIGLCGVTFTYFIKYTFKKLNYKSLIFSSAYALMGFNIVYQSNIMWLDGVYLLPIVMVGINKIINKERKRMYVIGLTLSIMTNFYIGFMICIFSVIYFLYLSAYKFYDDKIGLRDYIYRVRTFIVCSIISGFLSMITILPTIYALQGGKSQFAFFKVKLGKEFTVMQFLSKFYLNRMNDGRILNGLPSIYTGILILILVILFFLNRKVRIFDKITALVMFLILFLSLDINKINYIWHGFNKPSGFPYRFTFVFSFLMVLIAYRGFLKVQETNVISIGLILVIFTIVSYYFYKKNYYHLPKHLVIMSLVLAVIYCIGIFIATRGYMKNTIWALIGLVFFIELGISGFNTFNNLPYAKRSKVEYYLNTVGNVMDGIEKTDKSFYRLDKNFYFNINDPMLINYRGISHFSSVYKISSRKLINGMGFLDNNVWTIYDSGSVLTANSLLNIKYVVSKKKEYMPGFKYKYEKNGLYVYENEYYLDAGFMVNNKVNNTKVIGNTNPFINQNELLKNMSNTKIDSYFRINDYKIEMQNVREVRRGNKITFIKKDFSKPGSFKFTFRAPNEYPLYLLMQSNYKWNGKVYVNGKFLTNYSIYNYKTSGIGHFKKGELVTIEVKMGADEFVIDNNEIYYLNTNNFRKIYDILKENSLNIEKFNNRCVEGHVKVTKKDQILYTTIPYNTGWKVYINGKQHKYEEILGSLIGIKLNPGEYNIKFEFTPDGLYLGIGISVVTFILCMIYIGVNKKKRMK